MKKADHDRQSAAPCPDLIEEIGQRLTAIDLALQVLKKGVATDRAIALIELALDEARQQLKLARHCLKPPTSPT
jgi:hypothetical protein